MIEQFLNSGEFQDNIAPIIRLYFAAYARLPDTTGLNFWSNQLRAGMSLEGVAQVFVSASEFVQRYGALDNRGFVAAIYLNVLGRAGDAAGLDYWSGQLARGALSRGALLVVFAESDEYKARMASSDRVVAIYSAMLRRAPDDAGYAAAAAMAAL